MDTDSRLPQIGQIALIETGYPTESLEQAAEQFLTAVQRKGIQQILSAMEAIATRNKIEIKTPHVLAAYANGSILTGSVISEMAGTNWKSLLETETIPYEQVEVFLIGGGKMGGQMGVKLNEQELHTRIIDTNLEVLSSLQKLELQHIDLYPSIDQALEAFKSAKPKIVLLMIPAQSMPQVAKSLIEELDKKDVVLDLGNTHFKVTLQMYELFSKTDINYLAGGTSGGISGSGGENRGVRGARHGACFMIDGKNKYALKIASPVLAALAVDKHFAVIGGAASGHLAKGLHNAQEYAEMEAIGQLTKYWIDGLQKSWDETLSIARSLQTSNAGSYLIDCLVYGLENDMLPKPGQVGGQTTYEMQELCEESRKLKAPLPLVEQAITTRITSQRENAVLTTKHQVIQLLRMVFGGHGRTIVL